MKQPPYHLRPNKSVDRLLLVEVIRKLETREDLDKYTYYGFGGPYLEEFRLLYELCPNIKMVSIEEDEQIYKRQRFHLPCANLKLINEQFSFFLAEYESKDEKSVFWLDYTELKYGAFDDFMTLLTKVTADSVIKITLRAKPNDFHDKAEEFRSMFGQVLPNSSIEPPRKNPEFASLLQEMLQVAAEKALPTSSDLTFLPLSSFYYSDGTDMFTLTGMVCLRKDITDIKKLYHDWSYANLNWGNPQKIDLPMLSTKERLHLQKHLPRERIDGSTLLKELGHLVAENRSETIKKLEQYARFHRHYPYFVKAVP